MITRRQPPVKQNPQSFLHCRKIAENRRKTQKRCNFNLQIGCGFKLPQSKPDGFASSLWEGAFGTAGRYAADPLNRVWEENGQLCAGGGVSLAMLASAALGRNLTGLEFASGIPGSVGGAVVMNAGAYGGEMAQVLVSVTALDLDGNIQTIPAEHCGLGYRKSIFSDGQRLVLEARFQLESGDPDAIRARMDELAAKRKEKQPLEYPSAGSMFKRPEGYFAAALIDQCGLKGFTVGGAQVSEKHAGFVVNRGGATCADVLELVRQVQARVLEQTGVTLKMEVKVLR